MKCHDTMILNQCQTPAITPFVCSCLEKSFLKELTITCCVQFSLSLVNLHQLGFHSNHSNERSMMTSTKLNPVVNSYCLIWSLSSIWNNTSLPSWNPSFGFHDIILSWFPPTSLVNLSQTTSLVPSQCMITPLVSSSSDDFSHSDLSHRPYTEDSNYCLQPGPLP